MAKIKLNGDTSGYIEISAPAVSGNNTLELGPGTKILTNLDNTFTGITTFSNGIHITSGGFILNQQRSDTHASLIIDKPDAGTGTLKFFNNGSASAYIQHTNSEHLNYYLPSGSGSQVFYTNGTERLRITSDGKMGLGISSPARGGLHIHKAATAELHLTDDTTGSGSGDGFTLFSTSSSAGVWYRENAPLRFATNNTERLRIGSDGHLSYKNSSPPAWSTDSGYANATLGSSAYFRTDTDVNSNFFTLGSNAYRGSSNWQHVNSGWATQLQQSAHTGDLYYSSSSTSGSADGTITWVEHFRVTSAGNFGIGDVPSAGDGGNSNYNNWDIPKLHVRGSSSSGKFHLLGRFRAGSDADNTGAQIVLHHENDRGMALQGGRSVSNRSYGAIKALDNLAREATVMDFRGENGQGVDYIKFYTGNSNSTTEQFKIDSSGRISKPNQPAFSVRRNSSQDIPHNTNTKVQWNTEIFDVGGHFDSSTNFRFTAPVAGKYLFLGHLYIYSTRQVEAKIYKNGSVYKRFSGPLGTGGNDNPNGMDFMDIVDLSVNDYIEIFGYHYRDGDTNTVSIYGGNLKETSFVGYFLG